jgi:sulfur carrier protein
MAGTATATEGLHVLVNGEAVRSRAANLAQLVAELGYGGAKIATARNGEFVPERERAATGLAAGDKIEIVAPRQGG